MTELLPSLLMPVTTGLLVGVAVYVFVAVRQRRV
jgi:hypothetical protein